MHTANRQLEFDSAAKRASPADRMLNDATNVSSSSSAQKHKVPLTLAPSRASGSSSHSRGVTVTTSSTEHLSEEELRLLQQTHSLFLCCRNIHAIKHIQYLDVLKDHLQVLNLHMNCIRHLEPSTFQLYLTHLVELDLSANELHSLEEEEEEDEEGEPTEEREVGGHASSLRRRFPLSPSANRTRRLHGKENKTNSNNSRTATASSCFVGLVHLRRLNLGSNYLKFLHKKETFAPLVSLEWLSLAYNQLEDIIGLQGIPTSSNNKNRFYHIDLAGNCLARVEQVVEALAPHQHSIRELRLETTSVAAAGGNSRNNRSSIPAPPNPFLKENPFCLVEKEEATSGGDNYPYARDSVDAFPYSALCFKVFDNLQVLNGLSCQVNPLDDIQQKKKHFQETYAQSALDDFMLQEAPADKTNKPQEAEGEEAAQPAPRRKPFASRKERGDTPALPTVQFLPSDLPEEAETPYAGTAAATEGTQPMLTPPHSLKTLQTLNFMQQQQQQQQQQGGETTAAVNGGTRKKSGSTSSPMSIKKGKVYFSNNVSQRSLQVSPSTTNTSSLSPPSSPEQEAGATPKSALKWKPKMISRGTNTQKADKEEEEKEEEEPTEPTSFISHATDDTVSLGSEREDEEEERARRHRRRERRRERKARHRHADTVEPTSLPPLPAPPAPVPAPPAVPLEEEERARKEKEKEEEMELLKLRLTHGEEQLQLHTALEQNLRTQVQQLQGRLLQEQQQAAVRERQSKGQVAALKDELLRRSEELQLMANKYRADAAEEKRRLQETLTQQLQQQRQQEVGQLEAALQALQGENKKIQETLRTQNAGWNDFLHQLEGEERQREQAQRQALQQLQTREREQTQLLLAEQAARHQLEREAAEVTRQASAQLYASWFRLSQRALMDVHEDWQEHQQGWERYVAGLQEEHREALSHATAEATQLREEIQQLLEEKEKRKKEATKELHKKEEEEAEVEAVEVSAILPTPPTSTSVIASAAGTTTPSTAYWKETCERVEREKQQTQRALQVLQESQEALQHQNTYLLERIGAVTKEKEALQHRVEEKERAQESAAASQQLEKDNMMRTIHNLEEDLRKKDKLLQLIEEEAQEKIQSKREQIAELQEQLDQADAEKEKILSQNIKYTEEVEHLQEQVRLAAARDTQATHAREVEGQQQQQRLLATLRQAREQLVKEHRAHETTRHSLQLREMEVAEVKRELELLRERARSKEMATRAALAQLMSSAAGDM